MRSSKMPTPTVFAETLVPLVGLSALYLMLGAKALNLDGLSYAERVRSGDLRQLLLPGHLLYAPIMYMICKLVGFFASIDAARLMTACDSLFAATGVSVLVAALRKLRVSSFSAIASGLALGFTYTYWTHATDLTSYAFSTFCLICAFYIMCSARTSAKSVSVWPLAGMVALATLIHQSNVVFLPAAMVGLHGAAGSRWRHLMKPAAAALILICLPYALLGSLAIGSSSPVRVIKWAAQGAHGYAPAFEPVNIARGVYGFSNAIVYLDDAGTEIKGHTAGIRGSGLPPHALMRLAAKAGVVGLLICVPSMAYVRPRRLTDGQKWTCRVCIAWIVPYALVALLFFTTDHDRWIMLMPAVAALAAVAYPAPTTRGKAFAVSALAVLFAANLSSAIYPAHTGSGNVYYQEAVRLAPYVSEGDAVIFWGHDHIGTAGYLRRLKPVNAVHAVDMVLKHGKPEAMRELDRIVVSALTDHHRAFVIGLYGCSYRAGDYLSEAHSLGVTKDDVARALRTHRARPAFSLGQDKAYELDGTTR